MSSRTNLKLHNISVAAKMVKKVIINFDLSKTSGPDYILAELFSKCLKESCFPDCFKVSSVVPVFKACVRYFIKIHYTSDLIK